jgi:hypothetical protein
MQLPDGALGQALKESRLKVAILTEEQLCQGPQVKRNRCSQMCGLESYA